MSEQQAQRQTPQRTTGDCEELNDWSAVVGWKTDYRQLGKGRFDAWFNMSLCKELRVVDQYCSREMFATGLPPEGHVALLISLNEGDRGIFQGKRLGRYEVAVMGPGSFGTYRTPPDLRLLTLHLPISRLGETFQATCHQELDSLVCETRIIGLSPQRFDEFTRIARQLIQAVPGVSFVAAPKLWKRELESRFVTSLIHGLTGEGLCEPRTLARANRVRCIAAARDYIDAHLDRNLEIDTLARICGVSPRTLHSAFRDICDTTPLRYVKTRRLHAVRRRLKQADRDGTSVTHVALSCGFNHLGYFSSDYQELFGEHPSQTLGTG